MDPMAYQRLETTILALMSDLFAVADHATLRGRSREALVASLEHELGFLGLYPLEDTVTPQMIHRIVEQHIDHWIHQYLQSPLVSTPARS